MTALPTDPLPDDERARIHAEERYRQEVRTLLGTGEPPVGRVVKFLNTPLGLWFLSAVVAGLISAVYAWGSDQLKTAAAKAEADRAEDRKKKELVARLDLEISFRLSTAMLALHVAEEQAKSVAVTAKKSRDAGAAGPARTCSAAVPFLAPLTLPSNAQRPPLFPEFNNYNAWALVAERRRHTPEDREKLRRVLALGPKIVVDLEAGDRNCTPREVAEKLLRTMNLPAWSDTFPYTDCGKEKTPFC